MSASSYDVRASWPAPIQERLGEMEDMHRRSPHDRSIMLRLARFLLAQGDLNGAQKYMRRAGQGLASEPDGHAMMMQLGAVYVVAWQVMKSINPTRELEEVYMGEDRNFLLTQALNYMQQGLIADECRHDAQCLVQAGTAREFAGELTDALDMLSDVITNHQEYSALPAIIFKAGAILRHVRELEKAKEYLDYLEDIDLRDSGIPYSYYYAVLVTLYEELGAADNALAKKLQPQVKNMWLSLQTWFVEERRDMDDEKYGAIRRLKKDDFQHSAVVWVDLSMECLDSCQYLLASTFLTQAIARAPHPELLLLLAECYYMMKEHERAISTLERAYDMDKSHIRIKQLLLRWDPDTYVELFSEQGEEMEAAPDRYVPPSNRRTSLIRPSTGERRPGSAKRPGTADRPSNRTVMTIRPGTAQSDRSSRSSRPDTAGSDRPRAPPPARRKAVHPDRSLFKGIDESEVRRIYKRTIDNKLDYPQENEVLSVLARFSQSKTKYEVANTRIRLKHKFKTPTSVAATSSSSTKAGTKAPVAPSGSLVQSSPTKSSVKAW